MSNRKLGVIISAIKEILKQNDFIALEKLLEIRSD